MGGYIKLILVNLAVLLGLVVVAELTFGHWLGGDPLAPLSLHRNSRTAVDASTLYEGGGRFDYRRDAWGFRGLGQDPAGIDILTVGGSTTNQLYLPDEATWQAHLARALAERGRKAAVANAGIDGQSTVGILFNFERWFPHVPGLRPKLVIAYLGINDAMLGGNTTDRLAHSSRWKELNQRSAVLRLWKTLKGAVSARTARLTHERVDFAAAKWTDKPNFADNRAARREFDPAAYADRLRQLAQRIKAMGAAPVFVTQARADYRFADGKVMGIAADQGPNGVDQWRLLDEANRILLAVCAEQGIACLDLAGGLAFQDGDFYDFVHNTPQGARRIGEWLAADVAGLL